MNFLAHASLSPVHKHEVLTGNLATDLLKPAEIRNLSTGLKHGVELHHHIDRFTDQHPKFKSGAKRLSSMHGKYGKVVLDIIYDFLLTRNWNKLMAVPLQDFANLTYTQLEKTYPLLPVKIAGRFEAMVAHNWLAHYGNPDRLKFTFQRLAERASFPVQFEEVHIYIEAHEEVYTAEFLTVFRDVQFKIAELTTLEKKPALENS